MLKPLTDRVLVEPYTTPEATESGLVLVRDYAPEHSGTVVAIPERIGTDCPECGARVFVAPAVKVGDFVAFGHDAGQEIRVDGTRYLLMREQDISAIFESV